MMEFKDDEPTQSSGGESNPLRAAASFAEIRGFPAAMREAEKPPRRVDVELVGLVGDPGRVFPEPAAHAMCDRQSRNTAAGKAASWTMSLFGARGR